MLTLTSIIIIDFGNSLKSVLTSLVYTDVNQDKGFVHNCKSVV